MLFLKRKVDEMHEPTVEETADEIGRLQAQISDLESQVKVHKDWLTAQGLDRVEGTAFRGIKYGQKRQTLNRKSLEAEFGEAVIRKHLVTVCFSSWRFTPLAKAAAKVVK